MLTPVSVAGISAIARLWAKSKRETDSLRSRLIKFGTQVDVANTNSGPNLVRTTDAVSTWKQHCYSKAWGDRPSMPFWSQLWTRNASKKHAQSMIAVLRDCGKAEQVRRCDEDCTFSLPACTTNSTHTATWAKLYTQML